MPKREQLEELLKADPDDVFLQYALAMSYVAEGDASEGISRFATIIDGNPDYVAAYFQSGQLLADQGDTEEARSIITTGIEAARRVGDDHAESEMIGFLQLL